MPRLQEPHKERVRLPPACKGPISPEAAFPGGGGGGDGDGTVRLRGLRRQDAYTAVTSQPTREIPLVLVVRLRTLWDTFVLFICQGVSKHQAHTPKVRKRRRG